jgi:serine/tyrosine/threonine adenylyltransferase
MSKKVPLSSLPVSHPQFLLPANLTPDAACGTSPKAFVEEVLSSTPSAQRRSRLMDPSVHFSFVSPFPYSFPYDIQPPEEGTEEALEAEKDKGSYVERWLSARETRHGSTKLYSKDETRNKQPRVLLSLSKEYAQECLPELDIESQEGLDDLVDVLSGKAMIYTDQFAPYALRYSGHQFGSWAGQLGDGRAVTVCEFPHSSLSILSSNAFIK